MNYSFTVQSQMDTDPVFISQAYSGLSKAEKAAKEYSKSNQVDTFIYVVDMTLYRKRVPVEKREGNPPVKKELWLKPVSEFLIKK